MKTLNENTSRVEFVWCEKDDRWIYIKYDKRGQIKELNFWQGTNYDLNEFKNDPKLVEFFYYLLNNDYVDGQNIKSLNKAMWLYINPVMDWNQPKERENLSLTERLAREIEELGYDGYKLSACFPQHNFTLDMGEYTIMIELTPDESFGVWCGESQVLFDASIIQVVQYLGAMIKLRD